MAELTIKKLREVKEKLKANEIKPYKGFIGVGVQGFFEIKDEQQFQKLKKRLRKYS